MVRSFYKSILNLNMIFANCGSPGVRHRLLYNLTQRIYIFDFICVYRVHNCCINGDCAALYSYLESGCFSTERTKPSALRAVLERACISCVPRSRKCISSVPRCLKEVYQFRPESSKGRVSVASRCPFQV